MNGCDTVDVLVGAYGAPSVFETHPQPFCRGFGRSDFGAGSQPPLAGLLVASLFEQVEHPLGTGFRILQLPQRSVLSIDEACRPDRVFEEPVRQR